MDIEWETRPYQQFLDSASEKSKAMTGDVCTNVLVESGYCGKHQGKVVDQAIFEPLWAIQLSFWVSALSDTRLPKRQHMSQTHVPWSSPDISGSPEVPAQLITTEVEQTSEAEITKCGSRKPDCMKDLKA